MLTDDDDDIIDLTNSRKKNVPSSEFRECNGIEFVTGIDPGPVNNGIAVYSLKERKFVLISKYSFRQSKEELSISKLIVRVTKHIDDNKNTLYKNSYCGVEKQFENENNQSIEHIYISKFGEQSRHVFPHALKSFFVSLFPFLEDMFVQKGKGQYSFNKKNATLHGMKYLEQTGNLDALDKTIDKIDDAFDAMWICIYTAIQEFGIKFIYTHQDTVLTFSLNGRTYSAPRSKKTQQRIANGEITSNGTKTKKRSKKTQPEDSKHIKFTQSKNKRTKVKSNTHRR